MNLLRAIWLIMCFFLLSDVARPQALVSGIEIQKRVVAKIRVSRPSGAQETATAIYVGKDKGNAYFITAFHAVTSAENSQSVVAAVEFQLWNSPDLIPGEVLLSKFDADLDLAVVMIPNSRLPSQLPQLSIHDPIQTSKINIIGHPPAGNWSVWSGTIQNSNGPQGKFQYFVTTSDSSLTPGYSGGPVFDLQGNLLGMHIRTEGPSYATAI